VPSSSTIRTAAAGVADALADCASATTCDAVTIRPRFASTTKPLPTVGSPTSNVASIVTMPCRAPA
jgi:hypothetical protein